MTKRTAKPAASRHRAWYLRHLALVSLVMATTVGCGTVLKANGEAPNSTLPPPTTFTTLTTVAAAGGGVGGHPEEENP
jgi:hypothetical protein